MTVEPDGAERAGTIVTAGADDPERMVSYFALPGCQFEVLEPPEVARAVGAVAERFARAATFHARADAKGPDTPRN